MALPSPEVERVQRVVMMGAASLASETQVPGRVPAEGWSP
jgi:hypothetical protein